MDMIPKPQPGRISPYKAYGAAVTGHRRLGRMLKYDKSSWLAGTSAAAVLIEIGTELVAIIPTLRIGWVKFVGGELVDSRMGLLSESFVMPRRNELDDFDGANWEKRPDGSTKDPWSRNNELVLVSPGDDEIFTYCTGSRGGLSAIGELCSAFNDELPFYPLVALGTNSYVHKDKSLGRVHVPTLKIAKYVDAEPFDAILAAARNDGLGPDIQTPTRAPRLDGNDNGDGASGAGGDYPADYGGPRGGPIPDDIEF